VIDMQQRQYCHTNTSAFLMSLAEVTLRPQERKYERTDDYPYLANLL
jgi:hypothetical protein